jgi:hypothetical protein
VIDDVARATTPDRDRQSEQDNDNRECSRHDARGARATRENGDGARSLDQAQHQLWNRGSWKRVASIAEPTGTVNPKWRKDAPISVTDAMAIRVPAAFAPSPRRTCISRIVAVVYG